MELALSPQSVRFIEEQVKTGNFPDAVSVVEAALAELRHPSVDEDDDDVDVETLVAIREGEAQLARGEGIDFDTFKRDFLAKINSRR